MSGSSDTVDGSALKRTPLHALHRLHGARMVPFAGYEMPVQYGAGVLKEHLHTRAAAGLFDVSHMGQIAVRAHSGKTADAARALEQLIPVDILGLHPGRQRYGFFTDEHGGISDDLMIANLGDRLLLVVNAACKVADEAHLRAAVGDVCTIEVLPRALLALQGPMSEPVLASLSPGVAAMRFMDVGEHMILGARCIVSRSGYTGEDGYEISVPEAAVADIAGELLRNRNVLPIGLGARDSLRLEAGLCLHGADIDRTTTPIEADLGWAMQAVRRPGGARAGGYPGEAVIARQLCDGAVRRRVGLRPEGRAPVRAGAPLFSEITGGEAIGIVTSGGFGPSLDAPIAMGYVPRDRAGPGTRVFAEVRGKRLSVAVAALPFVAHRYKRG